MNWQLAIIAGIGIGILASWVSAPALPRLKYWAIVINGLIAAGLCAFVQIIGWPLNGNPFTNPIVAPDAFGFVALATLGAMGWTALKLYAFKRILRR